MGSSSNFDSESVGSESGGGYFTAAMEFLRRRSFCGNGVSCGSTETTSLRTERFRNFPRIMSTMDRDEWPIFSLRKVGTSDLGLISVAGSSQLEPITEVDEEEEDEADRA